MIVACVAGVGGGNFASSMANINVFYPQRLKGWALGLNAGGGNIGVAAVQLVGLLVLATVGAAHPRLVAGVYIPLIVLAALGAAFYMDNVTSAANEKGAMRQVSRDPHTWIMSFLYIGTFGSFIGFGFAFGQVLQVQFKTQFSTPIDAAYVTFLGPLLGSLIRPVGGWMADRLGGARVTFWNFVAMAVGASIVLYASTQRSLPLYLVGFIALFVFSGVGNGSTYKMIPGIFKAKAALAVAAGADRSGRRAALPPDGRGADRHRRGDRRLRRCAGQHRVPPVVPDHPVGGRGVPELHRLLRCVFRGDLGVLPAAVEPPPERRLTAGRPVR